MRNEDLKFINIPEHEIPPSRSGTFAPLFDKVLALKPGEGFFIPVKNITVASAARRALHICRKKTTVAIKFHVVKGRMYVYVPKRNGRG